MGDIVVAKAFGLSGTGVYEGRNRKRARSRRAFGEKAPASGLAHS